MTPEPILVELYDDEDEGMTIDLGDKHGGITIEGLFSDPSTWQIVGVNVEVGTFKFSCWIDENLNEGFDLSPPQVEALLNAPCNIHWY